LRPRAARIFPGRTARTVLLFLRCSGVVSKFRNRGISSRKTGIRRPSEAPIFASDFNTRIMRNFLWTAALAAVDYLSTREDADPGRIGIVGICGWGGFALNAAAIDTRIRATVASTMYDMSRVTANGYFDTMDSEARYRLRRELSVQRTADARSGSCARAGGVADPLPEDAPQFVRDYHAYYKTPRGYHERSLNSNDGWNKTSALSFVNMPILAYSDEIRSAVLLIHGETAHSRYFSEDAFKRLTGSNKELMIVPGASHTDLYDNSAVIPFDRMESFFRENLQ
jgi:fermentation-respiration switch protein FrsA (DUF1100 family)